MTDRLQHAYSPHFHAQFADQLCAANSRLCRVDYGRLNLFWCLSPAKSHVGNVLAL